MEDIRSPLLPAVSTALAWETIGHSSPCSLLFSLNARARAQIYGFKPARANGLNPMRPKRLRPSVQSGETLVGDRQLLKNQTVSPLPRALTLIVSPGFREPPYSREIAILPPDDQVQGKPQKAARGRRGRNRRPACISAEATGARGDRKEQEPRPVYHEGAA